MFYGLIVLAGILTLLALKVNLILFRMAAAASWLALGIWLLIGGSLSLSDPWVVVLGLVFVMMTIALLTLQMMTEVRREARGKSWTEWSRKEKAPPRSRLVKERHKERLGAIRERRRGR